MNYKNILFFLGIFSLFVSFFSVINILYSIYFDFISGLNSYLITFVISFFIGLIFFYIGKKSDKNISVSDQIVFILSGFVYIPFLISIPYFLSDYDIGLLNSYFESVSGFTTTGFSTIEYIKKIDEPLLLWRSSSQWLGGLFFLIVTIGTMCSEQIKMKPGYLVYSEVSGRNFYNNYNFNFIKILLIYTFTTIFIIFVYNLINLRLLDSFNLAFTTISSGGFLPVSNLSNIVSNDLHVFVLSSTLLFPIFNFYLIFNIITKKFEFKKHQEDFHLASIIIILSLFLYFFVFSNEEFVNLFFAITSSISTSGIYTHSLNFDASLFFILATVLGGSLISTSSGFKYIRFYIMFKVAYKEIYKLVKPKNIFNKNLFNTDTKIDENDSKISFLVFISLILAIFVLSCIFTLDTLNFEDAFKLSILTLTNTTASSLYELNNISFFDLNNFTKMSLIFFMTVGRIEIIAILYLIKRFIFRE